MKKFINLFTLILLFVILVGCQSGETPAPTPVEPDPVKPAKLLLNGNFGGTLNAEMYGEGAPVNGEYDHVDSGYYTANDYFNMKSTATRTLFPKFQTYQQTMQDSSGLACALMILNYSQEDVVNTYSEEKLVQKYEELNETTVYGNGTSSEGLVKLFSELGYSARDNEYVEVGSTTAEKIDNFSSWIQGNLNEGRFVMVRFQDNRDFGWHIIVGMDTVGSSYSKSHVLIMADPYDTADHVQDGFFTSPLGRFYRWWGEANLDGTWTDKFDYVVVGPNRVIEFERVEETYPEKAFPELHLYLNADGSYGGTRDAELYGTINEMNGVTNINNSIYYNFPDYYNMESTETLKICTGFRAFQQTMASSCGICSTMTTLAYLGEDITVWDEVALVNKYEELTGKTIKGSGVGESGLEKTLLAIGYTGASGYSYAAANYENRRYQTYEQFQEFVLGQMASKNPIPVSWKPHGGHWEVIIGLDTMGTDYIYDDVIILADSHDIFDHYQDGYNTIPATQFYRQWFNGSHTYNQQHVVVPRK